MWLVSEYISDWVKLFRNPDSISHVLGYDIFDDLESLNNAIGYEEISSIAYGTVALIYWKAKVLEIIWLMIFWRMNYYDSRIFIYGSSLAYGYGVNDEHTIASFLQKNVGEKYKVCNCSNIWKPQDLDKAFYSIKNHHFQTKML